MRIVSLAAPFLLLIFAGWMVFPPPGYAPESPHGSGLRIKCKECHSPEGWHLDSEKYAFDHNKTDMPLEGQHQAVNCRSCHPTLVFSDAETDCFSCHTDIHNQTVDMDCGRCHTSKSWIVENIIDLHRYSRFPLHGPHRMAHCAQCHPSSSSLFFEPLGVECIDCHMKDYQAASQPNHQLGAFSLECLDCHLVTAFTWGGSGYDHSFFPLTQGHALFECSRCHMGSDYANISSVCESCHQDDYLATTNPGHLALDISTNCEECHTTMPGWKPADFPIHDQLFPVFSGEHRNEWNACSDCHTNSSNYSIFSCLDCHEHNQTKMDDKHSDEADYQYNSMACLDCHPRGEHD